jgi:hypothetical protein
VEEENKYQKGFLVHQKLSKKIILNNTEGEAAYCPCQKVPQCVEYQYELLS